MPRFIPQISKAYRGICRIYGRSIFLGVNRATLSSHHPWSFIDIILFASIKALVLYSALRFLSGFDAVASWSNAIIVSGHFAPKSISEFLGSATALYETFVLSVQYDKFYLNSYSPYARSTLLVGL